MNIDNLTIYLWTEDAEKLNNEQNENIAKMQFDVYRYNPPKEYIAFVTRDSTNKLRQEISFRQRQIFELEDQIKRLNKIIDNLCK